LFDKQPEEVLFDPSNKIPIKEILLKDLETFKPGIKDVD